MLNISIKVWQVFPLICAASTWDSAALVQHNTLKTPGKSAKIANTQHNTITSMWLSIKMWKIHVNSRAPHLSVGCNDSCQLPGTQTGAAVLGPFNESSHKACIWDKWLWLSSFWMGGNGHKWEDSRTPSPQKGWQVSCQAIEYQLSPLPSKLSHLWSSQVWCHRSFNSSPSHMTRLHTTTKYRN